MKKFLVSLFIIIGLVTSSWCQITEAEYFIDVDPGVGNATSLAITSGNTITESFAIPTTGLTTGLHVLHVRVKGTNNTWSLFYRDYFYIHSVVTPPTASDIVEAEYFVDSDPGIGNGFPLTIASGQIINETFAIPTTGLSSGLHVLHIRIKDADNTWSLFYRDYFYIQSVSNLTTTPITEAEYFFDMDPGVGNATTIAITEGFLVSETLSIAVPADMTDGDHYLHLRVKDQDNTWSLYKFALFEVDSSLSVEEFNSNSVSIFPNPTQNILNINFKNASEYLINIVDINGKQIVSTTTKALFNTFDFSGYANGVYIIQLIDNKTKQVNYIKIIRS